MGQHLKTTVGIIVHQQHILLFQRPLNERTYGLWCFPGGTIEDDETPANALDRELWEEAGIQVNTKQSLLHLTSTSPTKSQDLYVYLITSYSESLANPENHVWVWAKKNELSNYPSFKINMLISEYIRTKELSDTKHSSPMSMMLAIT